MAYKTSSVGPGSIAALPPTIAATNRAPTIGAEDAGRPISPLVTRRSPRPEPWRQARLLGLLGLGNGNGTSQLPAWALPVGIGLVAGGLWVLISKRRAAGGSILRNMFEEDEPTCNCCG